MTKWLLRESNFFLDVLRSHADMIDEERKSTIRKAIVCLRCDFTEQHAELCDKAKRLADFRQLCESHADALHHYMECCRTADLSKEKPDCHSDYTLTHADDERLRPQDWDTPSDEELAAIAQRTAEERAKSEEATRDYEFDFLADVDDDDDDSEFDPATVEEEIIEGEAA